MMLYKSKITYKDKLFHALPLVSLTRKQWKQILKLAEAVESEQETFKALETLIDNQCRLEIIGDYAEYFKDSLNKQIAEKSMIVEV